MLRGATDYTFSRGHLKSFKMKKKYLHAIEHHSKATIIGFNMVINLFKYTLYHFIGIPKTFNKRIPIYVRYSLNYSKCM